MKIAIGADHAGFALKESLRDALRKSGHEVTDLGTNSTESTDYPDFAKPVATAVARGTVDRGILVCGTGVGMSIVANKVPGVRAGLAGDVEAARLIREHNDANVLALGARSLDARAAEDMARVFLETPFAGGRHVRRVNKITEIEQEVAQKQEES
jgi:ribose 5-phosphate isomerase B